MTNRQYKRWRVTAQSTWKKSVASIVAAWVCRNCFPYISLGDDFYSTGAFLWTSPRMSISILPGHDPDLCARAETDASASVGTEFELFGLRAALTKQVFDRALPPAASFPRSPECITS